MDATTAAHTHHTARMFGRCSTCKARFVAHDVAIGFNGRPVDGEMLRVDKLTWDTPCTDTWGHTMTWSGLKATRSGTRCGAKCAESTAAACKCECGGERHGEAA